MKITNITNGGKVPQELKFLLRKKSGIDVPVKLSPGQSIYGEVDMINNKIRVYERKRYLSVVYEPTPSHVDSYFAFVEGKEEVKTEVSTDEIDVLEEFTKKLTEQNDKSKEPKENKPKAGRPKGSTNSKKKKTKKKKTKKKAKSIKIIKAKN